MVKVYRYKVYDVRTDNFRYSSRMATRERVAGIDGGEVIEGTETDIDESLLSNGWTEENFEPSAQTSPVRRRS